jgi:hypothetical protein
LRIQTLLLIDPVALLVRLVPPLAKLRILDKILSNVWEILENLVDEPAANVLQNGAKMRALRAFARM